MIGHCSSSPREEWAIELNLFTNGLTWVKAIEIRKRTRHDVVFILASAYAWTGIDATIALACGLAVAASISEVRRVGDAILGCLRRSSGCRGVTGHAHG